VVNYPLRGMLEHILDPVAEVDLEASCGHVLLVGHVTRDIPDTGLGLLNSLSSTLDVHLGLVDSRMKVL